MSQSGTDAPRPLSVLALSALQWREARERFRTLGLSAQSFIHPAPVAIAGILLADRPFSEAEEKAVWLLRSFGSSWGELICANEPVSTDEAVFYVRVFAHDLSRRFLPSVLETIARSLRSGETTALAATERLAEAVSSLDFPNLSAYEKLSLGGQRDGLRT